MLVSKEQLELFLEQQQCNTECILDAPYLCAVLQNIELLAEVIVEVVKF